MRLQYTFFDQRKGSWRRRGTSSRSAAALTGDEDGLERAGCDSSEDEKSNRIPGTRQSLSQRSMESCGRCMPTCTSSGKDGDRCGGRVATGWLSDAVSSVTMINYNTGPAERAFWVLKL